MIVGPFEVGRMDITAGLKLRRCDFAPAAGARTQFESPQRTLCFPATEWNALPAHNNARQRRVKRHLWGLTASGNRVFSLLSTGTRSPRLSVPSDSSIALWPTRAAQASFVWNSS